MRGLTGQASISWDFFTLSGSKGLLPCFVVTNRQPREQLLLPSLQDETQKKRVEICSVRSLRCGGVCGKDHKLKCCGFVLMEGSKVQLSGREGLRGLSLSLLTSLSCSREHSLELSPLFLLKACEVSVQEAGKVFP